jgi:hypothetical protein
VPKSKRAKVLTHRPKLQSLKQTAVVPTIEEVKFIERAEAIPVVPAKAMETVPAMPAEASADAVEELETRKQQKNNLSC